MKEEQLIDERLDEIISAVASYLHVLVSNGGHDPFPNPDDFPDTDEGAIAYDMICEEQIAMARTVIAVDVGKALYDSARNIVNMVLAMMEEPLDGSA